MALRARGVIVARPPQAFLRAITNIRLIREAREKIVKSDDAARVYICNAAVYFDKNRFLHFSFTLPGRSAICSYVKNVKKVTPAIMPRRVLLRKIYRRTPAVTTYTQIIGRLAKKSDK